MTQARPADPLHRNHRRTSNVIWLSAILILPVVILLDRQIMVWSSCHINRAYPLRDFLHSLVGANSLVGILLFVAITDRPGHEKTRRLLLSGAIAFGLVCFGKVLIDRQRPHYDDLVGATVASLDSGWRGLGIDPWRALEDPRRASFPSGHSAIAFAIALTIGAYHPRLRAPLLVVATACACSRVFENAHWPSDCLAGAIVASASVRMASCLGAVRTIGAGLEEELVC